MDDKKPIQTCSCCNSETSITDEANLFETIYKLTVCPHCGVRLANPTELFNHVVMFHSS